MRTTTRWPRASSPRRRWITLRRTLLLQPARLESQAENRPSKRGKSNFNFNFIIYIAKPLDQAPLFGTEKWFDLLLSISFYESGRGLCFAQRFQLSMKLSN